MTTIEIAGIKRRKRTDKLFRSVVFGFTFTCLAVVFVILYYIFEKGITCINWSLFTQNPKPVGESGGGVLNAMVGTIMLVSVAAAIAIPLGISVGLFLAENRGKGMADKVSLAIDVLQGVPSIVVGMVVYIWIVKPLGTFSAFSGSIALAIMMLPPVIKNTEETLVLIPNTLKEAALALGASDLRTTIKVMLPAGIGGIFSGAMLGIARILGEVAPLLFTAFGNPYLSFNIMKPVNSLPQVIFNYGTSPYDDWHRIAWGGSVILVGFVIILNFIVKFFESKWKVQF
ncbi:MAG TPA: phosphate ABC transporter permease PstA [Bacteroidia bacterium]|nr:phosphate ABC transporter permease PstA [Bacteroidia bacterium]